MKKEHHKHAISAAVAAVAVAAVAVAAVAVAAVVAAEEEFKINFEF